MTMSRGNSATGHAYYIAPAKPSSQSTIRIISLDPTNPLESSSQKYSGVKLLWSKMSEASSSESSSNCQYKPSSEGPPGRIQEVCSWPINVAHNVEDRRLLEVCKLSEKTVILLDREANKDVSSPKMIDGPESTERSKSFPVLRNNRRWDLNNKISRRDGMLDRIASESSQVRMEKFKKIVAYVESTGWSHSGIALSSENPFDDCSALVPLGEIIELKNPALISQKSFRFFNETKGITFLSVNNSDKKVLAGTETKIGYQHYRPLVNDLTNIAKNENPSIKSIYFPPTPEGPSLTVDRRSLTGDSRHSRIFSRNCSELAALSRIENELVPLRNEFSELTGKVRALNLTGTPSDFCAGRWIESSKPSEPMSCDTSGYFLHRNKVLCHHDSPGESSTIHDSRLTVLPAVNNAAVLGDFVTGYSWVWREKAQTDCRQSQNLRRIFTEPSHTSFKHSQRLGNNGVQFFHEKPFAYGLPCSFPIGHGNYPGKSMCFGNTRGESKQGHLSVYQWSQRSSILPRNGTCHFPNNVSTFLNDSLNEAQLQATSKKSCRIISNDVDKSRRCTDSRDNHIYFIDGEIRVPSATADEIKSGLESFCVSRKPSLTPRQISATTLSFRRICSKEFPYKAHPDNDARIVRQRDCGKMEMISQKISNSDELKHYNERRRPEKSERMKLNSRGPRIIEANELKLPTKMLRNGNNLLLKKHRDSQDTKVCHTTGAVISHPVGKIVSPTGNSESLNFETKTSHISVEIRELDNLALAEKQRKRFTGTYAERTFVRSDNTTKQKVTEIPRQEVVFFHEISVDPRETPQTTRKFEDRRDRRTYKKRQTLPVSDKKITIVPVMYTSQIPDTLNKCESLTRHHKKVDRKLSHQHQSMSEKSNNVTNRSERSSTRRCSVLSTNDSEASPSFTGPLSYPTDKHHSFLEHEKSRLAQWRTDCRLSVPCHRSTSVSPTLHAERVLRTVASRSTMTQSSSTSILNRETFYRGINTPITLSIPDTNNSGLRRIKNYAPTSSARGRPNDQVIGISTSPDDFLNDAWSM